MKAYIRYGANDTIISGVLVKSNKRPTGVGWVEIPLKYCCGTFPTVTPGARHRAFVKYTRSGQVIGSSTIIRKTRPASGIWVEVPYNRCCSAAPTIPFTVEFDISGNIIEGDVTMTQLEFLATPPLSQTPISGEGVDVINIPEDTTVVGVQYSGDNQSGEALVARFYDSADTILNSQPLPEGLFGPLGITPTISSLPSNFLKLVIDKPTIDYTVAYTATNLDVDKTAGTFVPLINFITTAPDASTTPVDTSTNPANNAFPVSTLITGSVGVNWEIENNTGSEINMTITKFVGGVNTIIANTTINTGTTETGAYTTPFITTSDARGFIFAFIKA